MQLTINENIGIHVNKQKKYTFTDVLKQCSQNYSNIYDFYGLMYFQNVMPTHNHLINLYERLIKCRHGLKLIEIETNEYRITDASWDPCAYYIDLDQYEHMNI